MVVSKWVIYNLLINGGFIWGYNPLILTIDPNFFGTSIYLTCYLLWGIPVSQKICHAFMSVVRVFLPPLRGAQKLEDFRCLMWNLISLGQIFIAISSVSLGLMEEIHGNPVWANFHQVRGYVSWLPWLVTQSFTKWFSFTKVGLAVLYHRYPWKKSMEIRFSYTSSSC